MLIKMIVVGTQHEVPASHSLTYCKDGISTVMYIEYIGTVGRWPFPIILRTPHSVMTDRCFRQCLRC